MAWTKMKTTAVVSVALLLAAGTTTVAVKEVHKHFSYDWDSGEISTMVLDKAPPQLTILRTKYPKGGGWSSSTDAHGNERIMGINQSVYDMLLTVYGSGTFRTVKRTPLPPGNYDFIANLKKGAREAMKNEIKKRFGITGRKEQRDMPIFYLRVKQRGAEGLKVSTAHYGTASQGKGKFTCVNQGIWNLSSYVENYFETPIIDQTGLKDGFDINLHWDERSGKNPEALKAALEEQLGLELVAGNEPVEMLVIEKTK